MDPKVIADDFLNIIKNHYFDTKGRVRRSDFWHFILACFVVNVVVVVIGGFLSIGSLLSALITLALLLPIAGMGARRLQDTNKDGRLVWALVIPMALGQIFTLLWFLSGPYGPLGTFYDLLPDGWIQLVGFVALIALIYFWVQDGTRGPNQYGADPKNRSAD